MERLNCIRPGRRVKSQNENGPRVAAQAVEKTGSTMAAPNQNVIA